MTYSDPFGAKGADAPIEMGTPISRAIAYVTKPGVEYADDVSEKLQRVTADRETKINVSDRGSVVCATKTFHHSFRRGPRT
jgi:hypothetical protein